ncbi:hypothetical protein F4778DRAFT_127529 [Xylariomycetidae sp. FL2044]|nr:hypothetical protein F4778DRAFT_127529 [Xylariomycetidae sp. FL2044]
MEGTPNYFGYSMPEDEVDEYDFFCASGMAGHQPEYHQDGTSGAYVDDYPADLHSTQSYPSHSIPVPPVAIQPSAAMAMNSFSPRDVRSRLAAPQPGLFQLSSPGLSSTSSSTPDTRASHHVITPDNMPLVPAQKPPEPVSEVIGPPVRTVDLPPRNKRRPRKPKPREEVDPDVEETKRNKFLERNRVAATKCRQKKKEWVSDLEETKFGLESQNNHLQMEYNNLMNEVGQIRSQLMGHAHCGDANINKWIENEAKKFVLGEGERYDQMLANNFGPPPDMLQRNRSMSSNPSYPSSIMSPSAEAPARASMSLTPVPLAYRSNNASHHNLPHNAPGQAQGPPPGGGGGGGVHMPVDHDYHLEGGGGGGGMPVPSHVDYGGNDYNTHTEYDHTDYDGMPMTE